MTSEPMSIQVCVPAGRYSCLRAAKQGGSRGFRKGVHVYICMGVRFADFTSFFLKCSMEMK